MTQFFRYRWNVVALLTAAACVPDGPPAAAATTVAALGVESPQQQIDTALGAALSETFRSAARRALPAVVYVAVERDDAPQAPDLRLPESFPWFFEMPDEGLQLPPQVTTGTGFIYDRSGLVLTSGHVVEGASTVRVTLRDGRELDADVTGVDPSTDIAVLRLRGNVGSLETIELGSSDALQIGDWVLALGNPLGLDFTVTAGIVSAKGRQLTGGATQLEAFIQTDAAINPGNSGGPLIDLSGRAVGVNAAIYGGERYVGYGFAVPIDLARRVAGDLVEFGRVRRPRLGIQVSDVTAVDAEVYGLDRISGAEVNTVESDSPGGRAGLRPGDVIVQVDDAPIDDATALTTRLAQMRPGDTVRLTVLRNARRLDLVATLGEFDAPGPEAAPRAPAETTSAERVLGFGVEPFTPQLARRFGLTEMETGAVLITEVAPYSAAARAGVRVGQRILLLEGETVRRVDDVERIAARLAAGEAVSLRVLDPQLGETVINFRAAR
jgi:serine protease Do